MEHPRWIRTGNPCTRHHQLDRPTVFGTTQYGALAISEQNAVFPWLIGAILHGMLINAMLYENRRPHSEGKGLPLFNWASYISRTTGVVIDGLLYGDSAMPTSGSRMDTEIMSAIS